MLGAGEMVQILVSSSRREETKNSRDCMELVREEELIDEIETGI